MRLAIFQGNLTRDAEKRSMRNGEVIGFSLAVNRRRKRDDDTPPIYVDVSAFDGVGERLFPYMKKGKPFTVAGELDIREFTRKDGSTGFGVELRASSIDFVQVGSRQQNNDDQQASAAADDDDKPW